MSLRKIIPYLQRSSPSIGPDPDSFIMTFALGASDSITLPLINTGTYDFNVDWGDGSSDTITAWNQTERTHSYSGLPDGDYVVTITGTLTSWDFSAVTTSRTKLKNVIQWGDTSLGTLRMQDASNLVSVPAGLKFYGTNLFASFLRTGISSIPSGFIISSTVHTFNQTFRLTPITSIPSDLFDNCPNLSTLDWTFGACSITTLPSNLFNNNPNLTTFSRTFEDCDISSIPSGLFDNNVNLTTLSFTFLRCNLTSIPSGLFDNNLSLVSFMGTFQECPLTSIPSGLFDNNINVTNFEQIFLRCNLTSIPSGLFDNNINVTNFFASFKQNPITSIPSGLFDNNINVTNFEQIFENVSISSVPSGLFDFNVNVINFTSVFRNISTLTTIPLNIFNNNINVVNYNTAFLNCSNLSISVSLLVSGMTMTSVTSTNQMFSGCTSLTGNGTDLIAKPKAAGYTVGTATNTGSYKTFYLCTSLTDYATIPNAYK